jgi:hypothetical protein
MVCSVVSKVAEGAQGTLAFAVVSELITGGTSGAKQCWNHNMTKQSVEHAASA